jgi:hypothetical protein
LALAGIAVTVASLAAAELLRRALEISFSNPLTRATYPWTARIDLVTIVVLIGSIAVLAAASLSPNIRQSRRPDWSRIVPWTVLVLVLAAAAGVTAGPPAAIGTLLLYPIVLWVGPRIADSDDPWLLPLLGVAFVARALVAVGLSAYGLPGRGHTVFDDEMAVYQGARQLEVFLWQGTGELTFEWRHLEGAQLDLTGAQFALFGDNFTLTRIVNAALGTLAVAFVYGIAARFRGATEARAAAVVAALWPTLVIWGGSGLREPLSILLTLLFPWLLVRRFGKSQRPFVVLAVSTALITLLLLAVLRPPAALAMVAALLVAAVWTPLPGRRAVPRGAIVGAAVVVGVVVIGLSWRITRDPYAFMQQFTPRALEYRQAAAELTPLVEGDRTRLPQQPDPSFMVLATIVRAVPPGGTGLETGVLYWYTYDPPGYRVLFEDGTRADLLPSQVFHLTDETVGWSDVLKRPLQAMRLVFVPASPLGGELRHAATAPDTLTWDVLLVLAAIGAWRTRCWRSSLVGTMLVVYPLVMVLGMGILATNLGTLLRHRSLIVPFLGILGAPLLVQLAPRTRPALRRVPAPAAIAATLACLAIVVADAVLNFRFDQVRSQGPPTAWGVLPWSARFDLLLLIAFVVLVGWQIYRGGALPRPEWRWRLWLPCLLLALVAAVGLNPLVGVAVVATYALVVLVGPFFAGTRGRTLDVLLATAVSVRLLAALGFSLYGLATHGAAVLDDEVALNRAGIEVGAILAVGKGDLQSDWWHLPGPYLSSIGALYWLVEPDFALVRVANAALGGLAVVLVWSIARSLFGVRAAWIAGWLMALWPSFVLWSGTGLRESAFAVTALLVPWLLIRYGILRTGVDRLLLVTAICVSLYLTWTLREYTAVGILAGLAVAFAAPVWRGVRGHGHLLSVGASVLVIALAVSTPRLVSLYHSQPVSLALGWVSPRGLEYRAAAIELSTIVETDPRKRPAPPDPSIPGIGTLVRVEAPDDVPRTGVISGYEQNPFRYDIKYDRDTNVVVDARFVERLTDASVDWSAPVARLVAGFGLLVLPPWPLESLTHAITLPDVLAWDLLAVLALIDAVRLVVRRPRSGAWLVLVVFPLIMLPALALASSYVGTVVRHRAMLAPWLAILAADLIAACLPAIDRLRLARPSWGVRNEEWGRPALARSARGLGSGESGLGEPQ